jgi:hypothetical protein
VVATFIAIHGLATRAAGPDRRCAGWYRSRSPPSGVVPLLGLAWFVLEGPGELTDDRDTGIPAYMVQDALRGPAHGILVIRGSVGGRPDVRRPLAATASPSARTRSSPPPPPTPSSTSSSRR